uniref:Uncharacterized protein n=1 Tax=Streptomyces ambofaciens TaxID=1889 RepID=Q0JW91_STRAM|nr:hypothetical protein DSMT0195 [Streptomyces ambofaciens]CAK51276.1 hypothetical protein DSMT0195 [Streptomyces ambofaciens]
MRRRLCRWGRSGHRSDPGRWQGWGSRVRAGSSAACGRAWSPTEGCVSGVRRHRTRRYGRKSCGVSRPRGIRSGCARTCP